MGVRSLLSFLKFSNLRERVELADIAAEYRKNTGKKPVLLVDFSSSLIHLYSKKYPAPSGELKKFKQDCQEFLDRFHDLDIWLYIIENGSKKEFEVQSWMKSAHEKVESVKLAYSTGDITLVGKPGWFIYGIAAEVFKLSDKCEFHRSGYTAMHYIAQYLKANGAFGVLSNNSDIILLEGSHYFLSIEDLDLSEMTTFNFKRDKLAESLKIKSGLLPHVGILCPNNILDQQDLEKFFRRNCKKVNKFTKFKAVADVVREYLSDFEPGDYSPARLHYCRSQLCLDDRQLEKYMKRLKMLNGEPDESKVIENKHWNEILSLAKTLNGTGRIHISVLGLLQEKRFFATVELENVNFPTPDEELQNLRREMYGFLFCECPQEATVTEYIYSFRCDAMVHCEVTFQRRDHVGLLELWSEDPPEDIQNKKYKYFFEIINKKLDPNILTGKVEEEFVFPLLATFYLRYEVGKFNHPKLVDILLMHSILANNLSASDIAEYECELDLNVVDLCSWYLKIIDHLMLVNSVCGHPFDRAKTDIVNYYDGLLLHSVYRDKNGGYVLPKELQPTFVRLKKIFIKMEDCRGF